MRHDVSLTRIINAHGLQGIHGVHAVARGVRTNLERRRTQPTRVHRTARVEVERLHRAIGGRYQYFSSRAKSTDTTIGDHKKVFKNIFKMINQVIRQTCT